MAVNSNFDSSDNLTIIISSEESYFSGNVFNPRDGESEGGGMNKVESNFICGL